MQLLRNSILPHLSGLALLVGGQVFLPGNTPAHWMTQIFGSAIVAWVFISEAETIEDRIFRLFTRGLGIVFALMAALLTAYLVAEAVLGAGDSSRP